MSLAAAIQFGAVADLHPENGSFYALRGPMLPPYDTADTLSRVHAYDHLDLPPIRPVVTRVHHVITDSRGAKVVTDFLQGGPFQSVIWLGCTSKSCASSASVFSPFKAARATFALNAGV